VPLAPHPPVQGTKPETRAFRDEAMDRLLEARPGSSCALLIFLFGQGMRITDAMASPGSG
jgi:hypothetical protein